MYFIKSILLVTLLRFGVCYNLQSLYNMTDQKYIIILFLNFNLLININIIKLDIIWVLKVFVYEFLIISLIYD